MSLAEKATSNTASGKFKVSKEISNYTKLRNVKQRVDRVDRCIKAFVTPA